jgi:hypothetical protein
MHSTNTKNGVSTFFALNSALEGCKCTGPRKLFKVVSASDFVSCPVEPRESLGQNRIFGTRPYVKDVIVNDKK